MKSPVIINSSISINMQRQQSFNSSSEQQPQQARLSEGTKILIATAASAANERRGQKTIMNCFRDRTPSYSRSNSHIARANGGLQQQSQQQQQPQPTQRPDARAPMRARPIKLTLLKSSSTRDLNRLLEFENFQHKKQNLNPLISSTSISDLSKMTSSSASNSSTSSSTTAAALHRSASCLKYTQQLEQRIAVLERQLNQQHQYNQEINKQLQDMNKKINLLTKDVDAKMQTKHKKPYLVPAKKLEQGKAAATPMGGSAAAVVQPSKLAAWMKLSNFWKQRPSIQTLKDQNIYNDEPCFDTEIELVLKDDVHKTVPKIVVDCCQLIEEKYRKSSEPIEGIYRQCGDYNKMQALRFSIDANNYDALRQSNVDIHTLAGVLKLFLREIKSPLISANEAKTFIGKPNQWVLADLPVKLETLRRLVRSLPEVNRDTMEYLFAHFNKLTKVPLQHISAETLAISVTPSIYHAVQQGARMQDFHALLKESEILSDCVKIMIEYNQKIFECTADRKQHKHRISVRNLKKTLSHPDLLFQNLF